MSVMKRLEIYKLKELFEAIEAAELLGFQYKIETTRGHSTNLLGEELVIGYWWFSLYWEGLDEDDLR